VIKLDALIPAFMRTPWLRFKNVSGETIPAFAVMRVTGISWDSGEIVFECNKPSSTAQDLYMVNGPRAVIYRESDQYEQEGVCTPLTHHAGIVLCDNGTGSAAPEQGQYWSPEDGSWELTEGGSQFYIWGGVQENPNRVVAQQVKQTSDSHGYASIGSAITACDHKAPGIFDAGFGGMPSLASVSIRKAVAATGKFASLETGTLFNPLPFTHEAGDYVAVEKCGDAWLISKCLNAAPVAHAYCGAQALSSGGDVSWGTLSVRGGIAALAGSNVQITCPVTSQWFKIWATVYARPSVALGYPGSFPAPHGVSGGVTINGTPRSPQAYSPFTMSPGVSTTDPADGHSHTIADPIEGAIHTACLTQMFTVQLSQGDTIGFDVTIAPPHPSGDDGYVESGTMIIEPAFSGA
jgi:hypothetical protein